MKTQSTTSENGNAVIPFLYVPLPARVVFRAQFQAAPNLRTCACRSFASSSLPNSFHFSSNALLHFLNRPEHVVSDGTSVSSSVGPDLISHPLRQKKVPLDCHNWPFSPP